MKRVQMNKYAYVTFMLTSSGTINMTTFITPFSSPHLQHVINDSVLITSLCTNETLSQHKSDRYRGSTG